jgi:hypothetical protein
VFGGLFSIKKNVSWGIDAMVKISYKERELIVITINGEIKVVEFDEQIGPQIKSSKVVNGEKINNI